MISVAMNVLINKYQRPVLTEVIYLPSIIEIGQKSYDSLV